MLIRQPRYSKEEFAQRGDLVYSPLNCDFVKALFLFIFCETTDDYLDLLGHLKIIYAVHLFLK